MEQQQQTMEQTIQLIYQASVPRNIICPHCDYFQCGTFIDIYDLIPEYVCDECFKIFYVFKTPLDFKMLRHYLLYQIKGIKFLTLQHYLLHFNIHHPDHTIPDIYNDLKNKYDDYNDYLLYKLMPDIFSQSNC
jgi:hypothetical protein